MSNILISGYYGFKNSGDDALLAAIISNLKQYNKSAKITVLSVNPKETSSIYNVKSINRYNIFAILNEMRKSNLLISGGGSLLQDGTSSKSLYYYLSIINLAKWMNLKTMVYANGIGPIIREKNVKAAAKSLNMVDMITLRDYGSYDELKAMKVEKPEILVTADPAFTLNPASRERGKQLLKQFGIPIEKPLVVVSVRNYKKIKSDFCSNIAKACDYMSEKYNITPLLIPMQIPHDIEICKKVKNLTMHSSYIIDERLKTEDMLAVINETICVMAMRLHMLIYSANLNIPSLSLSCDPKMDGFMNDIGINLNCDVSVLKYEKLVSLIDELFANRNEIKEQLYSKSKELRSKALDNAKIAMSLLS